MKAHQEQVQHHKLLLLLRVGSDCERYVYHNEREMHSKSDFNTHFLVSPLGATGGDSYAATLCINEPIPVIILQEV